VTVVDLPKLRSAVDMEDVEFIFPEPGSQGDRVRANKTLLACASEVFRTQFFGSFQEKEVLVEDSSVDTFKMFIDILYNEKKDLKELNLKLLGELFYLAEKYQIATLKEAIVKTVKVKNIETEGVIEAMTVAEKNAYLPEFANSIHMICATHVLKVFKEGNIFEFFKMFEVREPTSAMLHKLMTIVSSMNTDDVAPCENCKHSPCLNNSRLSRENFVEGAVVSFKWLIDNAGNDFKTVKIVGKSKKPEARICDQTGFKLSWPVSKLRYKCK